MRILESKTLTCTLKETNVQRLKDSEKMNIFKIDMLRHIYISPITSKNKTLIKVKTVKFTSLSVFDLFDHHQSDDDQTNK